MDGLSIVGVTVVVLAARYHYADRHVGGRRWNGSKTIIDDPANPAGVIGGGVIQEFAEVLRAQSMSFGPQTRVDTIMIQLERLYFEVEAAKRWTSSRGPFGPSTPPGASRPAPTIRTMPDD